MRDKLAMKDTFRFDGPGTIGKPGPIGRLVRFVFGLLCLWLIWQIVVRSDTPDLFNPTFWVLAAFGLMLAPYVVNIGFGVRWGAWPGLISALLLFSGAVSSFIIAGHVLETPFWATVAAWMVYIYGHLGISFILSAVLATPGCEMRAIPHLSGILLGKEAREHYCPGFIENVDQWEKRRNADPHDSAESQRVNTAASQDMVDSAGGQILLYGIPFVALQLAGSLGGFIVATAVPALAFLFVGGLCVINAWRAHRVHCYFMGPWCVIAGTMTALYSLGLIDFGPGSWSLIVNTGLAGAAILYLASERIWGKYFGAQ